MKIEVNFSGDKASLGAKFNIDGAEGEEGISGEEQKMNGRKLIKFYREACINKIKTSVLF